MYEHWTHMVAGNSRCHRKLYNKLTMIFRAGYLAPIYEKWLENADEKLAFWMERLLIKSIGRDSLCNLTDGGDGSSGVVYSVEMRRKMGIANIGNKYRLGKSITDEHRKRISESKLGKPVHTLESRRQMSETRKGRPLSAEHRRKIGASHLGKIKAHRGRPLTVEHRKNISLASRGRNPSAATLQSNIGRIASLETLQKMRASQLGKKASPETREKLSIVRLGKKRGPYKLRKPKNQ
jgi:hypothetical protein